MRRRLLAAALCGVMALTAAAVPTRTAAVTVEATLPSIKILTMGDSITCGGTCTATSAYRGELSRLLDLAGQPHTYVIAAVGGVGCGYWVSRAQALVAQHQPNVVLLSCGTNDGVTAENAYWMELAYRQLIANLLAGSSTVKVVPAFLQYASIGGYPYPAKAPAWLANTIPVANDSLYRALFVAPALHGPRVPAWASFESIPEAYLDEGGVHPTASGYIVMARIWYQALRPVYGWPVLADAELPCGMSGRRPDYGSPPFEPIRPTGCVHV